MARLREIKARKRALQEQQAADGRCPVEANVEARRRVGGRNAVRRSDRRWSTCTPSWPRALDGAVPRDRRPAVRWIGDGSLAAAVGDVPAAEFDEGPLNAGMADMGWLGPRAVAHQEVNPQLHEHVRRASCRWRSGPSFATTSESEPCCASNARQLRARWQRVRGRQSGSSRCTARARQDLRASEPAPGAAGEIEPLARVARTC